MTLRRQGTFEQVEAVSGQDQCSLRLTEQWTNPDATRLPASSSLRQSQVNDIHPASLASCRYDERGDARTIESLGGYSTRASIELVRPADRHKSSPQVFHAFHHQSQERCWGSQNTKVMERFSSQVPSCDLDSKVISETPPHDGMYARPVLMNKKDTEKFVDASTPSGPSTRRLRTELKRLAEHGTIDGWTVGLSTVTQIDDFVAFFSGPIRSPYEGGVFYVRFKMPGGYPYLPPICQMLTRTYHPNIDARGRICVDILYDQWGPQLTSEKILVSLASLLDEPSVTDPLVPEIAEQCLRDPVRYEQLARIYTQRYAIGGLPQASELDGKGQPWWTDVQISQETQLVPVVAHDHTIQRETYSPDNGPDNQHHAEEFMNQLD